MRELQPDKRQAQVREVADLILVATLGGRKLSPEQLDLIRKQTEARKIPADVVDAAIATLDVMVCRKSSRPQSRLTIPYKLPAMDPTLLAQISRWLKILDKGSLYELLDLPVRTPAASLVRTAGILYARWSKVLPKTSECVAWEKCLQACMTYLKDQESRSRYNHSLYNQRVDRFLERVDLVLAGGELGRSEQAFLGRIGTQEFGLSQPVVEQCVRARAATSGVGLGKPVNVSITMNGQVQCRRCYSWNQPELRRCYRCGSSLRRKCANPDCGAVLADTAKACEQCGLTLPRSRQYAELLRLAQVCLDHGRLPGAVDACRLARQVLDSRRTSDLLARASKIRDLLVSLKTAAANRAWTRAMEALRELATLAPHLDPPGVPSLEELTERAQRFRQRLDSLPDDVNSQRAARFYVACLADWTDSEEAYHRARQICYNLEEGRSYRAALTLTPQIDGVSARRLNPACVGKAFAAARRTGRRGLSADARSPGSVRGGTPSRPAVRRGEGPGNAPRVGRRFARRGDTVDCASRRDPQHDPRNRAVSSAARQSRCGAAALSGDPTGVPRLPRSALCPAEYRPRPTGHTDRCFRVPGRQPPDPLVGAAERKTANELRRRALAGLSGRQARRGRLSANSRGLGAELRGR